MLIYNGVVEVSEDPSSLSQKNPHIHFQNYFGQEKHLSLHILATFSQANINCREIPITEAGIWANAEADIIFNEEITICEYDAEELLSKPQRHQAAVALAEAEAAAAEAEAQAEAEAEAAAEAQAQAEAAAEAQAEAEAQAAALEADLAAAEQAAADAENALEEMIDAASVDTDDYSTDLNQDSQIESDVVSSNSQSLVEGESAIGELAEGNSDDAGLSVGMIILVTIIGVLGIGSAGVALLKMNR